MVLNILNKCVILFFILKCCRSSENLGQGENITKLYELVAGAIKDDLNKPHISRRVINDAGYQIHINKLKSVNGFKLHNIVINRIDTNSTIYINNPLESKLPHPFMTLAEFKKTIVEQRVHDRIEFVRSKKIAEDRKKWADIKATAKLKSKRTFSEQTYTKAMSSKKTAKIGTNTKSITQKRTDYNKPITTKGKPTIKEHTNMILNEKRTVKNLSSSTSNLKGKTAKLSTAYSRVKLLYADEKYPTLHRLVTHKNTTNIGLSEQTITTVFEEKSKNINDRQTNTTTEKKTKDESRKESTTVEEDQSLIVGDNDSANSNEGETTIFDGKSTALETESIISDEDISNTLDEGSTTIETETTVTDEKLTTVDEKEATHVDKEEVTNVDEGETTTVSETTAETITESSTTTTTTTLPPTTRERWSRPRVYLGDVSGGASTSSLIT